MSPHFLCCLPIRLGAFFVGLVEFLISGLVAALMWSGLYLNSQGKISPELSKNQKIAAAIFGASYTILFIASTFGILGVLRKRISWIQSFLSFLRAYLIGNTVVTIVNIVIFFIDNKDTGSCVITDSNGNCDDTSLSRGAQIAIVLVVAVVPLLILAYACWVLSDCVKYLRDKQVYPMTFYPFSNGGYAAVGPNSKEETVSLTHNSGSATGAPYAAGGV
ncbi:hypothetical protein DFH05DRAFT_1463499 [Lentinula detonsa]|uniref:Uncharacterized protein n=2 Tax=Lentinula TaxID=5352 RepID=A0AA38KBT4_9AGAR|nr:hypothetical protein DFH05DRAFT_1463499 [Lentinula detonsa]KAJ3780598.1 hypothetical protein GGU10DRAFT_139251 [Lentinula aff. detonsa]